MQKRFHANRFGTPAYHGEVDAFEVWWESKDTYARCTYTKKEAARAAWNASK